MLVLHALLQAGKTVSVCQGSSLLCGSSFLMVSCNWPKNFAECARIRLLVDVLSCTFLYKPPYKNTGVEHLDIECAPSVWFMSRDFGNFREKAVTQATCVCYNCSIADA